MVATTWIQDSGRTLHSTSVTGINITTYTWQEVIITRSDTAVSVSFNNESVILLDVEKSAYLTLAQLCIEIPTGENLTFQIKSILGFPNDCEGVSQCNVPSDQYLESQQLKLVINDITTHFQVLILMSLVIIIAFLGLAYISLRAIKYIRKRHRKIQTELLFPIHSGNELL